MTEGQQASVFRYVEARAGEFIDFASRLIQIPSVNPPGTYEVIAPFVADRMRAEGLSVDVVQTPTDLVDAAGLRNPRLSVLATLKGAANGHSVALIPHLDTVPAGDEKMWSVPPFGGVVKDGRLWGRGACDCKGRLACFALVMTAIKSAGISLAGDVTLAATPDEEIGGRLGVGYLVDAGILRPDYAIMEGYLNNLYYGNGGKLDFHLEVTGKATHPSTPWLGVNAVEKMTKLLTALYRLQDELRAELSSIPEMRHTTINVGLIAGGTKSNVIPEHCRAEVDLRIIPDQTTGALLERIEAAFARVKADDDQVQYTMKVVGRDEAYFTPRDHPLLDVARRAVVAVTGEEPNVLMSRGGSDAKHLLRHGVATISMGPGHKPGSHIHEVDENIAVDDFTRAAKAIALAVLELAGRS